MKWRIGDVTVTKIVEMEVTGGSRFILPQATYEEILPIAWLQPHFADERGRLKMSIHALVVEAPDGTARILVDTCLGNDKEGRRIPTWNNLKLPFLADLARPASRATRSTRCCARISMSTMSAGTRCWSTAQWVPTFPQRALSDGPDRIRALARQRMSAPDMAGGVRRIR